MPRKKAYPSAFSSKKMEKKMLNVRSAVNQGLLQRNRRAAAAAAVQPMEIKGCFFSENIAAVVRTAFTEHRILPQISL